MFNDIIQNIIPVSINIIKICGLSFSGYNILQILFNEKITTNKNILKYYKNKF